jgi:folate-binding protein YgfZ
MTELFSAALYRLDRLSTIVASGPDARAFLQGQLSFDLERLSVDRAELASCNSAQGRVQAVLWLIERSDGIVLVLPASMVDTTLARLRKYVLRAKVKLESGSDRFLVCAATDPLSDVPLQAHHQIDARSYVRWPGGERVLCLAEAGADAISDPDIALGWRRADIAAGLPQVYPATHEAFVAQMLNIDLLGGIGFEKGCYTGQEIIARTHFRGAIKRRMIRLRAGVDAPEPGTRIVAGEQHAGDVVDSVPIPNGRTSGGCELLAVVTLTQANEPLRLESSTGATLERLPLPYPL